ncbi:cation efflux protein [Melanogaster broomeanus]|nr:cation efflux protein [Melanogaster broomeanus]
MSAPDARTRRKISLQPAKVLTGSFTTRSFPRILSSNVLFVLALFAAKESLLSYDVGVFWVVMRVLALGGLGMLVWEGLTSQLSRKGEVEWGALGVSSLLLFLQQATLYTALYRLPSPRVILFAHFSSSWVDAMITPTSIWRPLILASSFLLSFSSDVVFSHRNAAMILPGYGCIVLHGLATYALEHLRGVLSPTISPAITTAASTLGAAVLALPLYAFRRALLDLPPSPILPLVSLAVLPLLAYTTVFLRPDTRINHYNPSKAAQTFLLSYPAALLVAIALGHLGFSQQPDWTDMAMGAMLYYALYPSKDQTLLSSPRTPVSKLLRFYLNSILSDNESRKIFYFLALNMCYMLVQMLYGVWTNSLGLISDAIHMAFDCLAIGVGLLASVMAKWPPNERFTYGYGRIETLSGFANGIFLILISIFIVFEAVQRILDPPEMSTNQLLLISSLGLGVNLFGMFAMGGHHHHHHGHGHDHGHGHSHVDHSHSPSHTHNNHTHHSHDHHNIGHTLGDGEAHSHSPTVHEHHEHSHSHDLAGVSLSSHSYQQHPDDDSHSCRDHTHSHSNSHSHSPPVEAEQTQETANNSKIRGRKPHSRGPSLRITPEHSQLPAIKVPFPLSSPTAIVDSPLSPSYPSTLKHDHHHLHRDDGDGHGYVPHEHTHEHQHGHSHEGHSHNMRGVFLHVMADTLGSVGVIISTLLIQYYGWTGFDPIASLFIAVLIVASVVPLVIDTGRVLSLDMGDKKTGVEMALRELEHIEGVASYTFPRFWPKDSSSVIGSIHIQLSHFHSHPSDTWSNKQSNVDCVLERVDTLLKSKIPGLEEVTIQLEEASGT